MWLQSRKKSARTYPKPFELLEGCRFDLVVMAVVPATPPFAEPRELPCILGGWKSTRLGHRWFQYGFSNPIYEPRNNLIGNHPIDAFWSQVLVACHGRKRMWLLVYRVLVQVYLGPTAGGTVDRGSQFVPFFFQVSVVVTF